MTSRQLLGAAACAASLAFCADANALALSIDGPGSARFGETVTVTFDFSSAAGPQEVVLFHDIFVAFDDAVLAYRGIDFSFTGIVSADNQGDPFFQEIHVGGPSGDYKSPPANQPPDHPWTYTGADYGDGSLRIYQYSDFPGPPYEDLFYGGDGWSGQWSGFTAFALTFEVIAQSAFATAIALIDDTSYAEHWTTGGKYYDYKIGDESDSWYPSNMNPPVVVTHTLDIPVPAPLALIGLGLACFGMARRFHPADGVP